MIRWNLKKESNTHTVYNASASCNLIKKMRPEMHKLTDENGKETWFGYVNGIIVPSRFPDESKFLGMSKTISLFIQEQMELENKVARKELFIE